MLRRTLLAALLLAPLPAMTARAADTPHAAVLSDAEEADLVRIETYLDRVRTLKARFLQVGPDGRSSGGTVWMQRPGRMRFQYDPPSPFLLVAGHGQVIFHDSQLDQTSNIPLERTPLGLLLRDRVRLSGDVTVTEFNRLPGALQVTLVRTRDPGQGSLTLVFADSPLTLRSWRVVDAQGKETTVNIYSPVLGGNFDQSLFTYTDSSPAGGGE
jgi:outer membrane lipoprotein-sorting protein